MTAQTAQMLVDLKGNLIPQYYSATAGAYVALSDATPAPMTAQISTVAAAARGLAAQITAYGTLRVSGEPGSLLNDTFEGTLDTTNRWLATGTVPPTSASGQMTLNGGTTNSATSILTSQASFQTTAGFLLTGCTVAFDAAKVVNANAHISYGFAVAAAPTPSAPIDNGYVWERDLTGELNCCAYVAGVRYVINSTNPALITVQGSLPSGALTSTYSNTIAWPAGNHVLLIAYRGDLCFWYIDSFDVPVGVAKYVAPAQQNLPVRVAQINAAASVLAITNTFSAMLVADSASQSQCLSDSTYPWRRQVVGANGGASVTTPGKLAKTFSAAFNVAPAAAATDVALISGNATNTAYVTRITVSGIQTTAGLVDVLLVKRSAADTGGTSTGQTAVAHDSTDAAAVSAVLAYTVNPAGLGAAVGTVRRGYVPVDAAASVVAPTVVVFDFGDKGKEIVLRGIAQQLAINLNGATLTGGALDICIEWFEA